MKQILKATGILLKSILPKLSINRTTELLRAKQIEIDAFCRANFKEISSKTGEFYVQILKIFL